MTPLMRNKPGDQMQDLVDSIYYMAAQGHCVDHIAAELNVAETYVDYVINGIDNQEQPAV